MEAAGAYVAYNRAWFYIKDIDLDNDDHIEAISTYGDDALETSLELGIKFFQIDEEYEKMCSSFKNPKEITRIYTLIWISEKSRVPWKYGI